MIRLAALALGLAIAACSPVPTQPPSDGLWPFEQPAAAKPRPRPKAAPRHAPARKAAKKKAPPAKAKRQHVAVPDWCWKVPAGTSIDRMKTEAKSRGIAWTSSAAAQAQACLNSKK
jgi:hypothetical protein